MPGRNSHKCNKDQLRSHVSDSTSNSAIAVRLGGRKAGQTVHVCAMGYCADKQTLVLLALMVN